MKHYGDITQIRGDAVEPVDVITGGSPCQDLSIAGKRVGLAGERSGLFMEQIRIIKEMREHEIHSGRAAESVRPRYMVWENVVGAFSSNGGEDFRAVLEETARVVAEDAVIPRPEKWSYSGCIMGDGWSIAWRTNDAQFWGVPQRRRRISLVADFGGNTAPEILFEQGSLRGDSSEGGEKGEAVTSGSSRRSDESSRFVTVSQDAYDKYSSSDTSAALKNSGGNYGGGQRIVSDTVGALCARDYKGVGNHYVNERKVIVTDYP